MLAIEKLKNKQLMTEIVLLVIIILTALYVGFYDPEDLTHPLHGDLLLSGNAIYNIYNKIPFEVNGSLQWIDERVHYFYTAPLYFYYASLFWDNSKDYVANFIPSTILTVIFTYLVVYLFARRYFGITVALLGLLLMSLSTSWYNYVVRSLYGSWAALPGICVLIYWFYIKFNETGKMKFMVYAGLIAGLAFYFTTWPLLVIVIPSLFVLIFILPSEISRRRRFFGYVSCVLIIAFIILLKEFIFLETGLRYKSDPSGVDSFIKIFFQGAYIGRSNADILSNVSVSEFIFSRLYSIEILLFADFSTFGGGLDISPVVLSTAILGILIMLFQKRYVSRFLSVCFLFIFMVTVVFIKVVAPRYLLPIFPIPYIASAFLIVNSYDFIKKYKINKIIENFVIVLKRRNNAEKPNEGVDNNSKLKSFFSMLFICIVSVGILWNIYGTYMYMENELPKYSKFEYNCYNSIEWPFPELKTFLNERKTVYDLIIIPDSFTPQMITYFRLHPGFVHLEGESYGKRVITYNTFRNEIENTNKRANFLKVLLIANNYNQLLNDQICPGWTNRLPYDKNALTMSEVEKLVPSAKFVKYVGSKNYPTMLALYEIEPTIKPGGIAVVNPPLPALPNKLPPGPVYSSGNYTDANTPADHYKAEYAFDGNRNTLWHSPSPAGTLGWIVRSFEKPTKITMFTITIRSDMVDQAPAFFVVSGSPDGNEWFPLGAVNDLNWGKGETKLFALSQNNQYYKFYKFDFISSLGNDVFVSIVDMDLFGE